MFTKLIDKRKWIMEWSTLKACMSDCIKHKATTRHIDCIYKIVLKDTTLITKMSKQILDYKHFIKVDKLKCKQ